MAKGMEKPIIMPVAKLPWWDGNQHFEEREGFRGMGLWELWEYRRQLGAKTQQGHGKV